MTAEPFTYEDFETLRKHLITNICDLWTDPDKQFLIGFSKLEPDWSTYDFERFPSIQWKIQNLKKLKETNPDKYKEQAKKLKRLLTS